MAYTSIYRKYRPDSFDKVIGQDHIVRTLKNQIISDTVGHAYIFTGTRGTGKTSVAKIFARAVNCPNNKNGSPCGVCDVCKELTQTLNYDIIELDAASNNSVDQIRELTDKINFPPTIGKYKVYIIDEVHMLSISAFNALLKTLEEPPAHAIFILATTEIHKIPATILSRCIRFDFRLVPNSKISNLLKNIFEDMSIKYEPQALDFIASAGKGSVRDALSIADMCVSYCNKFITYNGVLEVLGASDPNKLIELANSIADGKIDVSLQIIAQMSELGKSIPILASDLATLFVNVLYIQNCKQAKELLSLPEDIFNKYKLLSEKYNSSKFLNILKIMNSLEGEFHYSSQHRILFETAVVKASTMNSENDNQIKSMQSRIVNLEKKLNALINRGFSQAPARMDARQVWKSVASDLDQGGYQFLSLALLEAEVEISDTNFIVKIPTKATLGLLTEKNNRDVINRYFSKHSELSLSFEEIKKLDEDKALPFIKEMFGNMLEIK